jgi:hypothetical protein
MESLGKIAGFAGDGLTFVGSLCLAVDALFKRREQAVLSAQRLVADDFRESAETRDGEAMTPVLIDERALAKSVRYAWIGAVLLALGFACLFVSRLCGSGV